MALFEVWAPLADCVELVLTDRKVQMSRVGDGGVRQGWWRVELPGAAAGMDYRFAINGGDPLPDPRSPWQPQGVHGPSRTVDHGAHAWCDGRWQPPPLSSAIVYELHVGTFSREGTFDGVVQHLDHLVALGVTHVELMPVNEFPGTRGWGYDGVDLYAPHHAYGGPAGLKRLVDACHARGLAVLLDVVYNHLGPAGNYLSRFGPYFSDRYHTPWGSAINLDGPDSDPVRRFFCDNALMWLRDYHFDGLRIDAVHAIHDQSAVHFLEQLVAEVEALSAQLHRHLVVIAESDLQDPRLIRSRDAGGLGCDAQWSDDFHHALHAVLTGESAGYYADFGRLADVADALRRAYVYDGRYSAFRRRTHGRPVGDLPGHRFLGYLQNHDQVGNRATGDRTSQLMSVGRLKIGAALVLASPFVPMLFQGEEWGASSPFQYFTDHEDPELGAAVTKGRREEFAGFGWALADIPDPQSHETFARSKVEWSELDQPPHAELLDWHHRLIALRRVYPELADGRLDRVAVRYDEQQRWLALERGRVTIACNLSDQRMRIPLASGRPRSVLLASTQTAGVDGDGMVLDPDSVMLVGP